MPSSSSTSSDGKSSTRNTTSPASLRKLARRAAKARPASPAISSSDGARPDPASLIGHDDVRRLGRAGLEEADVERLLRLDGAQRLPGDRLQRLGLRRLPGAADLSGLRRVQRPLGGGNTPVGD